MIGLSRAMNASALAPRMAVASADRRSRIRRIASLLGLQPLEPGEFGYQGEVVTGDERATGGRVAELVGRLLPFRPTDWKDRPHLLTCRQAEYTFGLVARALGKDQPDGLPSPGLQVACDDLLEASIPEQVKDASTSLAVDWSDLESFSRPPPRGTSDCADPEASWGHRRSNLRHDEDELFFGYYLSDAITVPDEHGPVVPELARRMTVSACRHDPVPAFTGALTAMPAAGIPLGDVLSDSGYSHRVPQNWATPLRHSWFRTSTRTIAAPGAPTPARSSPTAASTAPARPARCCSSPRSPAPPPPRSTTRGLPKPPATSSAASPVTTPTATIACSARPPRVRSAAPCSRHR
jgi:hypothetical protein